MCGLLNCFCHGKGHPTDHPPPQAPRPSTESSHSLGPVSGQPPVHPPAAASQSRSPSIQTVDRTGMTPPLAHPGSTSSLARTPAPVPMHTPSVSSGYSQTRTAQRVSDNSIPSSGMTAVDNRRSSFTPSNPPNETHYSELEVAYRIPTE